MGSVSTLFPSSILMRSLPINVNPVSPAEELSLFYPWKTDQSELTLSLVLQVSLSTRATQKLSLLQ